WVLATSAAALGGCVSADGDPLDVRSASSAIAREDTTEVGGVSGSGPVANGAAIEASEAEASRRCPEENPGEPGNPGPGTPPAVAPGPPTYAAGSAPIAAEPVGFDPTTSMLERIYRADLDAGGQSFWFDRMLERQAGGNGGDALYTKGRAL